MSQEQLRILVIGAHPDDCELTASGVAARYARLGHKVKFVSVTNGDAGHQTLAGAKLAQIRLAEAQESGRRLGVEYEILDNHDGELQPTLENRRKLITLIRNFQPDLIMSPRPNDYHPDHRYTAQLIQDAAYMVTVPNVCPFSPHLVDNPAIVYVSDNFKRPYPFTPDVIVSIEETVDDKIAALDAHASQLYDWLPYNGGYLDQVPADAEERRVWLRGQMEPRLRGDAERFRGLLAKYYGEQQAAQIRYAEAFEWCEYGAPFSEERARRLFPFFD